MQLMCTVQQGAVTHVQRTQLDEILPGVAQRHLNTTAFSDSVRWTEVPSTYGYTAGKPSTSSLVRIDVPDTIDQPAREALMHAVCDAWMDVTGCTVNEIVVTAVNAARLPASEA